MIDTITTLVMWFLLLVVGVSVAGALAMALYRPLEGVIR